MGVKLTQLNQHYKNLKQLKQTEKEKPIKCRKSQRSRNISRRNIQYFLLDVIRLNSANVEVAATSIHNCDWFLLRCRCGRGTKVLQCLEHYVKIQSKIYIYLPDYSNNLWMYRWLTNQKKITSTCLGSNCSRDMQSIYS